mgnify:CR=1 FL=1
MPRSADVLVIGAGIAGLAAARDLEAEGARVHVLDKGRGPAGRVATRRVGHPVLGPFAFDHGAQFVTARGEAFAAVVEEAAAAGALARWSPRRAVLEPEGITPLPASDSEVWVGTPGFSALGRLLAATLVRPVRFGTQIVALERDGLHWWAVDDSGTRHGPFDGVLASAPAPQTAALFEHYAPRLCAELAAVEYTPCIAALLAFDRPLGLPFDSGDAWSGAQALQLAVLEASKPARATVEAWVLHGRADWSATALERPPLESAQMLFQEFAELVAGAHGMGRSLPPPVHVDAHRWRYAFAARVLGRSHAIDSDAGLAWAGDGALGARIEAAFDSGRAAAAALLARG